MEDRINAILAEMDSLIDKVNRLEGSEDVGDQAEMDKYSKLVIGSVLWIKSNLNVDAVIGAVKTNGELEYGDVIVGLLGSGVTDVH